MPKLTTAEKRARKAAYKRKRRHADPATRERERAKARARYWANRERRLAAVHAYQAKNRTRLSRLRWLRQKSSRVALAGRPRPELCEVCGRAGGIAFDHCHQRNIFRGWLCRACNLILGYANDDPNILRKLTAYLERTAKLVPPQLTLPGI